VASWWFGATLKVTTALVQFPATTAAGGLRAGRVEADGSIVWGPPVHLPVGTTETALAFPGAPAAGLAIEPLGLAGGLGPFEIAVGTGSRSYLVDGALADAVSPSTWTEVGAADDFTVFRSRLAPTRAWLAVLPSALGYDLPPNATAALGIAGAGTGATGSLRIVASSTDALTVAVRTPVAARVVIPTAYNSGWQAVVSTPKGSQAIVVDRDGLIESVDLPPGASLLRLRFVPPGLSLGTALSIATLVAFALAIGLALLFRRRRGATANPGGTASR
jgi:hypothetical protein